MIVPANYKEGIMKRLIGPAVAVIILIASAAFGGITIENRDLSKMEVVGNQLFLNKASGRTGAPDGKYFLHDNSFIIVVNGKIDRANSSALKSHPDLAAEVGAEETSRGLKNPGSTRMFNPQPEPPGHQFAPASGR